MSIKHTRDQLLMNPTLVKIVTAEATRVSRALQLDVVDSKEVYRSMVTACIEVAMTIAEVGDSSLTEKKS